MVDWWVDELITFILFLYSQYLINYCFAGHCKWSFVLCAGTVAPVLIYRDRNNSEWAHCLVSAFKSGKYLTNALLLG